MADNAIKILEKIKKDVIYKYYRDILKKATQFKILILNIFPYSRRI